MNRKQILDDAASAVLKDRAATHGEPENSFQNIASYWTTFLGKKLNSPIEPWQVPPMLGLLKVARLQDNPTYPDNWADLAGYAACGGELAKPDVPRTIHWDSLKSGQVDINNLNTNDFIFESGGAKHPNWIEVHFTEKSGMKNFVSCGDMEDVKKNGKIKYTLVIDPIYKMDLNEAVKRGEELLVSKSILINV